MPRHPLILCTVSAPLATFTRNRYFLEGIIWWRYLLLLGERLSHGHLDIQDHVEGVFVVRHHSRQPRQIEVVLDVILVHLERREGSGEVSCYPFGTGFSTNPPE